MTPGLLKWASVLVAALWLAGAEPSRSQPIEPEPIQLCARTDAYKAFEQIQYSQYEKSPAFQKQLVMLRNLQGLIKSLSEISGDLALRPDALAGLTGSDREADADIENYIRAGLTDQTLPTCYENPLTYFMLANYAKDIDAARKRLDLPLPHPVNLATLPTDDINAYTYPVLDDEERVVAVNTQMFIFAYQMTKVTLPTIRIAKADDKVAVTISPSEPDGAVLTNFTMAVLEFLDMVDPSTTPLNKAYDPLLITMVGGLEKFVIGHEYGHAIRGHVSPVGAFRLGSATDEARTLATIPVLDRSWQQELEADEIGFRLLVETTRGEEDLGSVPERNLYVLQSASFFFRCLEIIEEARHVRDTGQIPAPPTLSEKEFVRSYVAGATTPEQNRYYATLLQKEHPPTWLRAERIAILIDKELKAHPPSKDEAEIAQIALALDRNTQLIWARVLPKLPVIIDAARAQRDGKDVSATLLLRARSPQASPAATDCPMPADAWAEQSICTPELMLAVRSFQSGTSTDDEVVALYRKAIARDWLLLSGAQVRWARDELAKGASPAFASSLIALSGQLEARLALDAAATADLDENDRQALERARAFLSAHGRATGLDALADGDANTFSRQEVLAYPSVTADPIPPFPSPPARTPALDAFFSDNAALEPGGSLASIMSASLYMGQSESVGLSLLADLLIEAKRYDLALTYAEAGKAKGGLSSILDNTIGNVLSAQGQYRKAIDHYMSSLKAGRVDGWPEINIAMNYAKLDDASEAERWFKAGLERRTTARSTTEYARYLNEYAWFLASKHSTDKSRITEGLAYSLVSNELTGFTDADYLDTLAECLHLSGDFQHAIKVYEMAAKAASAPEDRARYSAKAEKLKSKTL